MGEAGLRVRCLQSSDELLTAQLQWCRDSLSTELSSLQGRLQTMQSEIYVMIERLSVPGYAVTDNVDVLPPVSCCSEGRTCCASGRISSPVTTSHAPVPNLGQSLDPPQAYVACAA